MTNYEIITSLSDLSGHKLQSIFRLVSKWKGDDQHLLQYCKSKIRLDNIVSNKGFDFQINGNLQLKLLCVITPDLKILWRPKNITDEGLLLLSELSQLEYLDLMGCNLTEKALPYLSALTHLRVLNLHDTFLSQKAVLELAKQLPNSTTIII